ncbi:helix-turn-helix protein [Kribbella sp. VKM Ac-2527]|uniref:Helix-turn-helix protein n=1 Tax=Kribbella caucasensis TaxID=2512215 RepID=A0A4V3C958_9ACTN|nr:AraC family transcriptional regulator [Kribbella sp. VKM Ac-2527]TDO44158.1 helix-turn-helix protein [Kribbella sp. VKM Ac-2527]
MNQPTDVFATFVDVLAEALDDHDVTGAELADRVQLSRSHLDRLVAAAAGERPGAFRRRVLLERAAYRLLTATGSILDIAVEAGYSSHEAFTRAFSRAYGMSPGRWRERPARLRLEAPSDIHFHPPSGLRVPARDKVTSMDLLRTMVDHHIWLVGQMIDRAATLTGEQLDARIELSVEGIDDEPTLRSLLSRLVGQLGMWHATLAGEEYDFGVERGESVLSMRQRLADVGPAFAGQVDEICRDGRLDELIVCPGERVEVYTNGAMIAHVLTFAAHRRTLVAGALHDAGFTDLDGGDPIRWITGAT